MVIGGKKRITAASAAVLLCFCASVAIPAREYIEDFTEEGRVAGWRISGGVWAPAGEAGGYVLLEGPDEGEYAFAVSPRKIVGGEIETRAAAAVRDEGGGIGSFGIMIKYIDENNWLAIGYGVHSVEDFGASRVEVHAAEQGRKLVIPAGYTFAPEPGRKYTARVILRDDRLMVFLDGEIIASLRDLPFAGLEGYAGVYAASPSSFDFFRVSGR